MSSLPPEDLLPARPISILFGPLGVARVLVNIFSSTGQRDAPSPKKNEHIRLITIGVSHFCEKARWGLDLLEQNDTSPIYYTEDAHPPPFLSFATLSASKNKTSASPMIVKADSSVLYKSNVILQDLCPFLYPEEIQHDVISLELDLGTRLGASVRCAAYHYILQKKYYPLCVKILTRNTSKVETVLFDKMLPNGVDKAMRKLIQVNESTCVASVAAVRQVFHELSKHLTENGGEYLMDTKNRSYGFTAADLTFAALSYVLIRPPEMNDFSADESELPPELVALGNELRATTAGQHALKMYKQHRLGPGFGTKVEIKTAGRDRNPLKGILYSVGVVGAAIGAVIWYRSH
jgi:glutathione S-transferase